MRSMSELFIAGAAMTVPVVAIFLRKGYGLGAMAMTGGGFLRPVYAASGPPAVWRHGAGRAVRLGFRKNSTPVTDPGEREQLFQQLLARM